MKRLLSLTITGLSLIALGCNYTGVSVEYAGVCDKANDRKMVEVIGFLDNSGSAMCSNTTGPMKCPIKFKDKLESEKWVNSDITLGSWSSEVEDVKDKGLRIRDTKSEFVERTEKVKLTAEVKVIESSNDPKYGCYMSVYKIEKTQ